MEAIIAIALLCGQPTQRVNPTSVTDDKKKQECQSSMIKCVIGKRRTITLSTDVESCYLEMFKK